MTSPTIPSDFSGSVFFRAVQFGCPSSNVSALGLRPCLAFFFLRLVLMSDQCFPYICKGNCNRCEPERQVIPRKPHTIFLEIGLSHVRGTSRSIWQLVVLKYATPTFDNVQLQYSHCQNFGSFRCFFQSRCSCMEKCAQCSTFAIFLRLGFLGTHKWMPEITRRIRALTFHVLVAQRLFSPFLTGWYLLESFLFGAHFLSLFSLHRALGSGGGDLVRSRLSFALPDLLTSCLKNARFTF